MMAVTYNMAAKVFKVNSADVDYTANMVKPVNGELDMGRAQLDDLFRKNEVWHDIYILSTQEAERSILSSMFNESKAGLINSIKKYFGIV